MKQSSKERLDKFLFFINHHLFQSILATAVIYLILLVLSLRHAVVVASLGATTYIIFALPKAFTARPKNVIGGHLIGIFCGSLFHFIPLPIFANKPLLYACAVGLSIFLMVITNTEHPPASGTALGVAIAGFSMEVTLAVIASVVVLSVIHVVFSGYLKDLR